MILAHLTTTIRKLRSVSFCFDFLFLFVSVWTLINSGSLAQYYIFKLLGSDSPSIYGSAFENGLARMPVINEFIFNTYSLYGNLNFLSALLIVFMALSFRTSIQIFFVSIVSSVVFITLMDTISLLIYKDFSIQSFFESLISNLVGSPVIASFIVFIFYVKVACINISNVSNVISNIAGYILYLLICLLIITISYYVICFFYRPTSVDFSVSTSSDFSGNYFTSESTTKNTLKDGKIDNNSFSILGKPVSFKNEFYVIGKDGVINSAFKKGDNYSLKISVMVNCGNEKAKPISNKSLSFDNVNSFTLSSPGGMFYSQIKDKDGYIKNNDKSVNMFDIEEKKHGQYTINKKNEGTIYYYPSEVGAKIIFSKPIINSSNDKNTQNVSFNMVINNKEKNINIDAGKLRYKNKNKPLECQIINLNKISNNESFNVDDATLVSILVEIHPEKNELFYSPGVHDKDSHFEINGSFLDITNRDVNKDKEFKQYFTNGYMKGFILYSFDKLSLNGKNVEVNKFDNLQVIGDKIYGRISESNTLVLSGNANLLYRNSQRENKTLWELSSENSILLGGFGAIFFALLAWASKTLIATIRKDEVINIFR